MGFYRAYRNKKRIGNFLVTESFSHKLKHFQFPCAYFSFGQCIFVNNKWLTLVYKNLFSTTSILVFGLISFVASQMPNRVNSKAILPA